MIRFLFLLTACTWTLLPAALAQSNRLLPTDDAAYVYVQRLQRRGHLLELDPTALPYTQGAVANALRALDRDDLNARERRWVRLLRDLLHVEDAGRGEVVLGAELRAGAVAANNDRLDPLRPTDAADPHLTLGNVRVYPEAAIAVFAEKGRFVAQAGLRHSFFDDTDPDGLDTAHRLYTRSEGSYLGYDARYVSAYFGRFSNHWAPVDEAALLLSDNPLPYDHLNLRLGGRRLALHAVAGELDSALPDGTYTGRVGDLPPEQRASAVRRFVSAHRLTWRPSRRLALSLMESVLYSSPGAGFSLKYLNPLQILAFEVDNRPKNDENNGLLGAQIWGQTGRLTLTGQVLLDDFDFMFASGEPGSLALTGSLIYAGRADAGVRVEAVSARAYNTHQPEGRYIYLLRGLATQFSDYVQATAFSDLYLDGLAPGLTLSPQLHVLWQGEADIRDPYAALDDAPTILTGTVERTLRPALEVFFQRSPAWWIRANLGANLISNEGFQEGARATRWLGSLSIGARLTAARSYDLRF